MAATLIAACLLKRLMIESCKLRSGGVSLAWTELNFLSKTLHRLRRSSNRNLPFRSPKAIRSLNLDWARFAAAL
jgi:hypothetical protein